MRARASVVVAFVSLIVSSCSDSNNQTYAQAAAATSLQVVAVGVHRAVTGDCWGRCSPGYLCNEESGLCERGECVPACEAGFHCAEDAAGDFRCVGDAAPWLNPMAPATAGTTPIPVAPVLTR